MVLRNSPQLWLIRTTWTSTEKTRTTISMVCIPAMLVHWPIHRSVLMSKFSWSSLPSILCITLIRSSRRSLYSMAWMWTLLTHQVSARIGSTLLFRSNREAGVIPQEKGNSITIPNEDHPLNLDLSRSIKGMYRILDLISEQGSAGLGEISA